MSDNGKKEVKIDVRFDWRDFLRRAGTDIQYARIGFGKGYRLHASLLCQRAVEKSLKAILLKRGVSFALTHSLMAVFPLCVAEEPEVERFRARCEALDAVKPANPPQPPGKGKPPAAEGPPEPTREEVEGALGLAAELLEWVRARLGS
ncbi:MAG: HEPN domain-containing protein [Planctomycetes bacterium]|nr:HEPN domain-containing protein [Planctomycetota bacterium]